MRRLVRPPTTSTATISGFCARWLSLKELAAAFGEMAVATPAETQAGIARTTTRANRHAVHPHEPHSLAVDVHARASSSASAPPPPRFMSQQRRQQMDGPKVDLPLPMGSLEGLESPSPHPTAPMHSREQKGQTLPTREQRSSRPSSSLLTLSPGYAQQLAAFAERQLLAEVERAYRRVHYGCMVQCLMELSHRLSRASEEDAHALTIISAAEASGDGGEGKGAAASRCRTDRLLEAALRCLAKMNLAQLEPDIAAAMRAMMSETPSSRHPTNALLAFARSGKSLSLVLGNQLLSWLAARVARFDAATSVTILHLLVQQRLFFSDEVLSTLVDNVLVSYTTDSTASQEPLSLNQFAVLLDAIARCETSIRFAGARWRAARQQQAAQRLALRRHRERLSAQAVYFLDSESDAATAREPAVAEDPLHPLCNADVYDRVVTRLIALVEHRRRELIAAVAAETEEEANAEAARAAEKLFPSGTAASADAPHRHEPIHASPLPSGGHSRRHASSLMAAGGVWASLDTASFFFLTRALGKLRYSHKDVVRALLPGMAEFLRRHPEQFLGVVLLVGRRDNSAADPALMQALLETLQARLEKRCAALEAPPSSAPSLASSSTASMPCGTATAGTRSGGASDPAPHQAGEAEQTHGTLDDMLLEDGMGHLLDSGDPTHAVVAGGEGEEGDDEAGAFLLSEERHTFAYPPSVPSHEQHEAAATARGAGDSAKRCSRVLASSHAGSERHVFAVSLVDTFTFHTFLEALCHQYSLTLRLVSQPAQPPSPLTAESLAKGMTRLHTLLLDDVHRGIPSLAALFRFSPAVLEQTLEQILSANRLLLGEAARQSGRTHGMDGAADGGAAREVDEGTARPPPHHHPLLIELAYVWSQLVAAGRLVAQGSTGDGILSSLLRSGVLERVVVVQRRKGTGHHHHRANADGDANDKSHESNSTRRYDSQKATRTAEHDADARRIACYVMPLPVLRAHGRRVLAHLHQSLRDRETPHALQRRSLPSSSSAGSSPAAADVLWADGAGDVARAKQQRLLLARHFGRFSRAAGL